MWSGSGLKEENKTHIVVRFEFSASPAGSVCVVLCVCVCVCHLGLGRPTGPKGSKRAPGGTAPGGRMSGIPLEGSKPE